VGASTERGDAEAGAAADEPRWRRGVRDVAVVAGPFLVASVAFDSWYSASLRERAAFEAVYDQGVYAHRVVAREVALLLERLLGDPLGEHLVLNGQRPHGGGMFTAVLVLNLVAAMALGWLVGRLLERRRVAEPARTLVMVTFGLLVALSQSTVTPYDLPAAALLLGVLVAAEARPPWDLAAIPLVVVGVATRESALVAAAALVAARWDGPRRRASDGLVAAVAGAAVATYLVGVVGSDEPTLWEALTVRGNLGRLYGWLGMSAMVGGWLLWRRAWALAGCDEPLDRRRALLGWMLASPYVVVALATGYWFEVRLLLPLLVAEAWLRTGPVEDQGQDTSRRQSSRPLWSSRTSRSPSSTTTTPAGAS
jgi:hypothetical protein